MKRWIVGTFALGIVGQWISYVTGSGEPGGAGSPIHSHVAWFIGVASLLAFVALVIVSSARAFVARKRAVA